MKRTAFTFRREWKTMLVALPPEVRAEVILAVVDYSLGDDLGELSSSAKFAFSTLKPHIEKEMKKAEKRREAGSKGGLVRSGKAKQNQAMLENSKQNQAMLENSKQNQAMLENSKQNQAMLENSKQNQAMLSNAKQCLEIRPADRINTGIEDPSNACGDEKPNKEEKNGKEETSFLPPTPPIYPKEEKEKKGETPSRPPLTPVEPEKFRLESAPPADETGTKPKRKPLDPASLPPGFVAFWNAYPSRRRVDKRGCFQKWKDYGLEAQAKIIVADVRKRAESEDWTRENFKFVPMSTTYLNQTRWDCAEIAQNSTFTGGRDPSAVEPLSPEEICRRRREAYFAEERRRNMLIYGKDACRNDDDDDFNETL